MLQIHESISAIKFFTKITFREKLSVLQIVFLYFKVTFILRYIQLKNYYYKYISVDCNHFDSLGPYKTDLTRIRKIIALMPGRSTCLKESIIVHLYFKGRGLAIPVYLGLKAEGELQAHAWNDESNSLGYRKLNYYDKGI